VYIALRVLQLGCDHIIVPFNNVYPDFNNDHKDFDSVPHRPLLQKLKNWVYKCTTRGVLDHSCLFFTLMTPQWFHCQMECHSMLI